jgi:hypothetical protein
MPGAEDAAARGGPEPSIADLVTEVEAAVAVGLTVGTLRTYRKLRKEGRVLGPDFLRVGSAVFYTRAAIEAYRAGPGA